MKLERNISIFRVLDEKKETRLSDFHFQQRLDGVVLDGAVFTLMIAILIEPARKGVTLFACFLGVVICIYFLEKMFCLKLFKKSMSCREGVFNGDLDSLILALTKAGLFLNRQVGDRYIFKSRNTILPNIEIVVKDNEDKCLVMGSYESITSLQAFFGDIRI